ncbi:MAG: tRNA pseudouridine(38-40) synthase TruA [Acidimicrobiia bacterium]|nr:tRNA pseudouridine(38-40) synthase TruA [Acidimicrobiia bacterium]
MPTYRIDLAYDGSSFHGYAKQPSVRTVQGTLETALFPHTGTVDTFVAGRTDKGVHASGQVVSFVAGPIDVERVLRSLNRQIGPEIAVTGLREVAEGFHARFSATGRAYRYDINNRPVHDPFRSSFEWTYADALDESAMDTACASLVGEHDFAAFCRKQENRPTVRHVEWCRWHRQGDRVELAIGASSFCHQMVRSIVAVSVEVGRGRLDPADVEVILDSQDRNRGRGAAPPHGLTLVAVSYGEALVRPSWMVETS